MRKMNIRFMMALLCIVLVGLLTGCGHTSKENEITGQIKKVKNVTPILFPDFTYADVSLGVMRNGVGSMSNEDMALWIPDGSGLLDTFKKAADSGKLVKIEYNVWRWRWFYPNTYATKITILE